MRGQLHMALEAMDSANVDSRSKKRVTISGKHETKRRKATFPKEKDGMPNLGWLSRN